MGGETNGTGRVARLAQSPGMGAGTDNMEATRVNIISRLFYSRLFKTEREKWIAFFQLEAEDRKEQVTELREMVAGLRKENTSLHWQVDELHKSSDRQRIRISDLMAALKDISETANRARM